MCLKLLRDSKKLLPVNPKALFRGGGSSPPLRLGSLASRSGGCQPVGDNNGMKKKKKTSFCLLSGPRCLSRFENTPAQYLNPTTILEPCVCFTVPWLALAVQIPHRPPAPRDGPFGWGTDWIAAVGTPAVPGPGEDVIEPASCQASATDTNRNTSFVDSVMERRASPTAMGSSERVRTCFRSGSAVVPGWERKRRAAVLGCGTSVAGCGSHRRDWRSDFFSTRTSRKALFPACRQKVKVALLRSSWWLWVTGAPFLTTFFVYSPSRWCHAPGPRTEDATCPNGWRITGRWVWT